MQQEDDLRALEGIVQFARALGVFFLILHIYWFCYGWLSECGLTWAFVDRILLNIQRTTGLFSHPITTKLCALLFLALGCYGTKSVRNGKVGRRHIAGAVCLGLPLFFLNGFPAVAARGHRLAGVVLCADPRCGLPLPAGRRGLAAAADETASYRRSVQ